MSTIDDVRSMRREGMSESDISLDLQSRGVSEREVDDAISQSSLMDAVSQDVGAAMPPTPQSFRESFSESPSMTSGYGRYEGMEPSVMSTAQEGGEPPVMVGTAEVGEPVEEQVYDDYGQQNYSPDSGYSGDAGVQYQGYESVMSSDVMSEIAEQVVSEKLSGIKDGLNKILEFRNVSEARLESLSERLKKLEMVIDRLQLSILQKVGDYVNDVSDLKKEVIETQKSFRAVHRKKGK